MASRTSATSADLAVWAGSVGENKTTERGERSCGITGPASIPAIRSSA